METLAAGESFSGECPTGQSVNLRAGEKLPNNEKPLVKVLKVDGVHFLLGPVKAGEIRVNVPCSTSVQEVAFLVNEMPPEDAKNRYKPLGTEKVEYPTTLFILVMVVILTPILASLLYIFRKKKIHAQATSTVKRKDTPRERLEKELGFMESNVPLPESHHFHQLYKRLRKFIETELQLKTRSLTTQEFLGTFRALAISQSTNQNLISQLEYLLKTADDVRFASKAFTPELWQDYLKKMRGIVAAFPKKIETNLDKGRKQR